MRATPSRWGVLLKIHSRVCCSSAPLWKSPRLSSITLTQHRLWTYIPGAHSSEVKVAVGSSGDIKLDICKPSRPFHNPPSQPTPSNSIILYLPRGPIPASEEDPSTHTLSSEKALQILSSTTNATVVRVAYRANNPSPEDTEHRFPTPVHDVLAAYDWVLKHLPRKEYNEQLTHNPRPGVPRMRFTPDPSRSSRIGVYGEYIGGGLATMLGLTECHMNKPGIGAIAVSNPILDWTFHFSPTKNAYPDMPKTLKTLKEARERLFVNHEARYDPFASPLLFFRTSSNPPPDSTEAASDTPEPGEESDTVRQRKYHLRYPPSWWNLRLPPTFISVTKDSIPLYHEQGTELATLMKRSISLHELNHPRNQNPKPSELEEIDISQKKMLKMLEMLNSLESSRKDAQKMITPDLEREERIKLVERDSCQSSEGVSVTEKWHLQHLQLVDEMTEVGRWFRAVLG